MLEETENHVKTTSEARQEQVELVCNGQMKQQETKAERGLPSAEA